MNPRPPPSLRPTELSLRLRRGHRPDNSQVVDALAQPVPANGPGDLGVGRATSVDLMGNCRGAGG